MTMISNYYAQVGVKLDKASLKSVRTYLNSIEKQLKSFQSKLNRGGKTKNGLALNVSLKINPKSISSVQRELNSLSRNLVLNISSINFSRSSINRAMKGAASQSGSALRINASLSQQSLNTIRSQIRGALSGVTIPGARAGGRISSGGGSSGGGRGVTTENPHSRRTFSPWHNPMMIGGGVGAFLRYGTYSLPFVAGAMGLNAMAGNLGQLQRTNLLLGTSSGSTQIGREQMEFLSNLGNRLGFTTSSIAPFYSQMFAGSRGTALESQLPEGFEGFMEYASVVGLSAEQKKGAARAISQMIAKRQVMAEELRGQLAEHGMPMAVQFMADAVAGGDVKKLSKMMEQGQVDPIEALPKFFAALKAQAQPFLNDFYNTIDARRGKVEKANEDWMKRFMQGGAGEGVASFFATWEKIIRDSIPMAEQLGRIFQGVAHYFNAILLAPGEILDWFTGKAGTKNFMQMLFGDVEDSSLANAIKKLIQEIGNAFQIEVGKMNSSVSILTQTLILMSNILTPIINQLGNILSLFNAYDKGGSAGLMNQWKTNQNMQLAREEADRMVDRKTDPIGHAAAVQQTFTALQGATTFDKPDNSLTAGSIGSDMGSYWNRMVEGIRSMEGGVYNPVNWLNAMVNGPSSYQSTTPRTVNVHITQDPLIVNARVEASTDAEVIANEITRRVKEIDDRARAQIITLSPMILQ